MLAIREYKRSRDVDPPILNLGAGWRLVATLTLWVTYTWEIMPLPFE
jgi:hypothetical protein